jgi:hypothetical protein
LPKDRLGSHSAETKPGLVTGIAPADPNFLRVFAGLSLGRNAVPRRDLGNTQVAQ